MNRMRGRDPYRWVIIPLLIAIPFSYYSLYGIRLVPIFLGVSILAAIFKGLHYRNSASVDYYALMVAYCFSLSLVTLQLDIFLAMFCFGWFVYWPLFVGRKNMLSINTEKLFRYFINFGVVLSLGLFFQIFLFQNYGIEIGKIDQMFERDGFGFIWSDYSFLSLYFVTLVPLSWRNIGPVSIKILYTAIFIAASAMTSARTGIVAIFIACGVVFLVKAISALMTLRIKKTYIYFTIVLILLVPIFFYYILELFPRISSFDDSGRGQGYVLALGFLTENIQNFILGAKFDLLWYRREIDIIPHNLFLYLLAAGGLLFLVLFWLWAVTLLVRMYKEVDLGVLLSLLISVIGFQFIPSIFSAYYFGFILSLCIVTLEQKKLIDNSSRVC